MRHTLTLLALLALTTCLLCANATTPSVSTASANSVAVISATNSDVGTSLNVICNQAIETATATYTAAGTEKNEVTTTTLTAAMIPANTWTRPAPAVNVIWPNKAANTTTMKATATTRTNAPALEVAFNVICPNQAAANNGAGNAVFKEAIFATLKI